VNLDLFAHDTLPAERGVEEIAAGAAVLRGFALERADQLIAGIELVSSLAPFRHLVTPGGFTMSVAMTNCGIAGWVSDRTGYRYDRNDPLSGRPWPSMPSAFVDLAHSAAAALGFMSFEPDACLINRYEPGARLSLHQDRDEKGYTDPIVSLSLGLPAIFQWGGDQRSDRPQRIPLAHGDVVVWGGPSRMRFHGVLPLKDGEHPVLGRKRYNITFRKAL
jgi:alkylated DNA repair protein (DNA oxidative demethylase)